MNETGSGAQGSGIPGWVWGMLAGVVIFAAGLFLGGFSGSDSVEVGGGSFGSDEVVITTTAPTTVAAPTTAVSGDATTETTTAVLEQAPPPTQYSDLPSILVTELPLEALDTLDLIASSGPYPFDRDGLTFQNREGLLPDYPRGHYQEFTVITPGLSHRGAKRIVSGAEGELYYTSDHYDSFREIVLED